MIMLLLLVAPQIPGACVLVLQHRMAHSGRHARLMPTVRLHVLRTGEHAAPRLTRTPHARHAAPRTRARKAVPA